MASLPMVETPEKTYQAGEAFASPYLRATRALDATLNPTGSKVRIGTATTLTCGTVRNACASADFVAVDRIAGRPEGTYVASEAIDIGDYVYGAAAGKVSTTATIDKIGIAVTATTADGQLVVVEHNTNITDPS